MADDAGVLQPLDVLLAEPGDPLEVEPAEGLPEVVACASEGSSARRGPTGTLEHELLEQAAVVVDREAPLGVVVGLVLGGDEPQKQRETPFLAADDALNAQPRFFSASCIASTDMRPARIAGSSSVRRRVSSRLVR